MAYNNYFPQNQYQQAYYPQYPTQPVQQMQVPTQPQPQANSIIWIQGEGAARSYLLAPNSSVVLFDSDEPMFYIKTADQTGMPNLRKFKFIEVVGDENTLKDTKELPENIYVTREEFEQFKTELKTQKTKTAKAQAT